MKRKLLFVLILLVLALVVYGGYSLFAFFRLPLTTEENLIQVKKGESFNVAVKRLANEGIIRHPFLFKVFFKLKGHGDLILHGSYLIKPGDTEETLLQKIIKGEVERYKLVIPEGYNIYQIGEVIERQKLGTKARFVKLAKDRGFIKELGLDVPTLEGYLFPATYFFDPFTKEEVIIKEMVQKTFDVLYNEIKVPVKDKNYIHRLLTIASMIEKEAKVKDELPLISAVLQNRLKKGMKLQCDPTVIYGIKNFNGDLTKADLKRWTPYNTYLIKGLPPTPIANPSKDAIISALNPAKVDYLYFVSKNDGTHYFSKDLKDHNKAVFLYQKKKRKKEDA